MRSFNDIPKHRHYEASMDVDHSGTVTEAEARQALKNKMPAVTRQKGMKFSGFFFHGKNMVVIKISLPIDR